MLENEVRKLLVHRFELREEAERRPRAGRELAGDLEARRRVGGLELLCHDLGESLDGLRIVRLGGDEMVARHPKPDPAIPRALA